MNLTAFALGPPYRGTLLRFLVISILIDRLRPGKSEGKLLLEQEFTCLIDKATRTEQKGSITTSTLIDILFLKQTSQTNLNVVGSTTLHLMIMLLFMESGRKTSTTT